MKQVRRGCVLYREISLGLVKQKIVAARRDALCLQQRRLGNDHAVFVGVPATALKRFKHGLIGHQIDEAGVTASLQFVGHQGALQPLG